MWFPTKHKHHLHIWITCSVHISFGYLSHFNQSKIAVYRGRWFIVVVVGKWIVCMRVTMSWMCLCLFSLSLVRIMCVSGKAKLNWKKTLGETPKYRILNHSEKEKAHRNIHSNQIANAFVSFRFVRVLFFGQPNEKKNNKQKKCFVCVCTVTVFRLF